MPTKFSKASFPRGLQQNGILVPHLESYDKWDQKWTFEYEPKGEDDAWHPSGDCVPSALELYESRLKPRRPIGPSLQRTFLVGHFWHQVIQKVVVELGLAAPEAIERTGVKCWGRSETKRIIRHHGCDTYYEGEPEPYHWARGQGDIVPLVTPKWTGLVDIKTMNTNDWSASEASGLLPLRFADKYEAQMNIYMDLFDQEYALILGVNKDSSKFIEFQFERNQQLIEEIYEKWEYVGECLLKGTPPDDGPEPALSFKGPIN